MATNKPDALSRYQANAKATAAAVKASGLTVGDLIPQTAQGLVVVPGFSTDTNGNLVTQKNLPAVQAQANTLVSGTGGEKIPDWTSLFWGSLGLDSSTISGLTQALTGIVDPTQAQAIGQQYLRGTNWYKTTFPGITAGITAGLFTDETGYRSYVNDLNQQTQQYLGRAVSSDEVTQNLTAGVNPTVYGQKLQGNALAQTLGPEAQYQAGAFGTGQLSQADLQAYGQEKAGYDTVAGQRVTDMLQKAQQRMQTLFQGTLAAPNLSLGPGGIRAQGLQTAAQRGSTGNGPDVGA